MTARSVLQEHAAKAMGRIAQVMAARNHGRGNDGENRKGHNCGMIILFDAAVTRERGWVPNPAPLSRR